MNRGQGAASSPLTTSLPAVMFLVFMPRWGGTPLQKGEAITWCLASGHSTRIYL